MKKFFLFFALLAGLISCSDEDNNTTPTKTGLVESPTQKDYLLPMDTGNVYTYHYKHYNPNDKSTHLDTANFYFVRDYNNNRYVSEKMALDSSTDMEYFTKNTDTILYMLKTDKSLYNSIPDIILSNYNNTIGYYDYITGGKNDDYLLCRFWQHTKNRFIKMDLLSTLQQPVKYEITYDDFEIDDLLYIALSFSEVINDHTYRKFYFTPGIGLIKYELFSKDAVDDYCLTDELILIDCKLK